jgi:hypothetical protein
MDITVCYAQVHLLLCDIVIYEIINPASCAKIVYYIALAGPPIVFPLLYRSYAEQQYEQLVTLLDVASETDNSILLGSFCHGPAVATPPGRSLIHYEMPFNFGYVQARGYFSPYVLHDGRCTLCNENPTVSQTSKIVDHIYVPVTAHDRVKSTRVRLRQI